MKVGSLISYFEDSDSCVLAKGRCVCVCVCVCVCMCVCVCGGGGYVESVI